MLPIQFIPEAQEEIWAEIDARKGQTDAQAAAALMLPIQLIPEAQEEIRRKAQVRMKTQLLASCVLNLRTCV